jgi:hypothetical protein
MRNKIYYRIGVKKSRLELHISSVKAEAEKMQAMSKAIKLTTDPSKIEQAYGRWLEEAKLHECIAV